VSKYEPERMQIDLTPGASGVVRDQFGWHLAYVIRPDGSVNWLGVLPTQKQAEQWVKEEVEEREEAF